VIYLDELLPSHKKILKAGTLIGEARGGRLSALGLFVAAIAYARLYLTDGVVPEEYLLEVGKSRDVIEALRKVRLLKKVSGARYQIHDFHQWNKSAEQIEHEREVTRNRLRRFRGKKGEGKAAGNGAVTPLPHRSVTPEKRLSPIHDPRSTIPDPQERQQREQRPNGRDPSSSAVPLTKAQKYHLSHAPADDGNYAALVRLTHTVMDAAGDSDPTSPDIIEAVKTAASEGGITYHPTVFNRALRSAGLQRVRGRAVAAPLAPLVERVRDALATNTLPQTLRQLTEARRR
jgi:hypothetical protein